MSTRNSKDEMRDLADKRTKEANAYANERYRKTLASGGKPQDGTCFPAGTLVETPHGPVRIEELKEGQPVICWSPHTMGLESKKIVRTKAFSSSRIYQIDFGGSRLLRVTRSHSLLTDVGWKKVANLRPGMRLSTVNGYKEIRKISRLDAAEPVFNLITETHFNFVAESVVAHNFTNFRWIRCVYWRLASALTHDRKRSGAASSDFGLRSS